MKRTHAGAEHVSHSSFEPGDVLGHHVSGCQVASGSFFQGPLALPCPFGIHELNPHGLVQIGYVHHLSGQGMYDHVRIRRRSRVHSRSCPGNNTDRLGVVVVLVHGIVVVVVRGGRQRRQKDGSVRTRHGDGLLQKLLRMRRGARDDFSCRRRDGVGLLRGFLVLREPHRLHDDEIVPVHLEHDVVVVLRPDVLLPQHPGPFRPERGPFQSPPLSLSGPSVRRRRHLLQLFGQSHLVPRHDVRGGLLRPGRIDRPKRSEPRRGHVHVGVHQ
mmetsp:Transcript_22699/g.52025  ORF Transcript_22699/g.52025 Transcript_22699/m.52025 type:complete len:271 (+) Transcript_22699:175-987(+)